MRVNVLLLIIYFLFTQIYYTACGDVAPLVLTPIVNINANNNNENEGDDELTRQRHEVELNYRNKPKSKAVVKGEKPQKRRTSRQQTAPFIYFLHIHKAGGTSLCEIARKQPGMRTPKSNCNPEKDKYRSWIPLGTYSDSQLTNYMNKGQFGLVANEFSPITNLMKPGLFTYMTCLRDPLDRVLSHYKYVQIWWPEFLKHKNWKHRPANKQFPWKSFVDFLNDNNRDLTETGEAENRDEFHHTIYPNTFGYSNFQTHMLTACGRACDSQSLALAKERLDYFSVIVIVEEWHLSGALLRKYGWQGVENYHSKKHQDTHSSARKVLANHPKELAFLIAQNELDLSLYEYGKALSRKLLAELDAI